eukprot:g39979.t1
MKTSYLMWLFLCHWVDFSLTQYPSAPAAATGEVWSWWQGHLSPAMPGISAPSGHDPTILADHHARTAQHL